MTKQPDLLITGPIKFKIHLAVFRTVSGIHASQAGKWLLNLHAWFGTIIRVENKQFIATGTSC